MKNIYVTVVLTCTDEDYDSFFKEAVDSAEYDVFYDLLLNEDEMSKVTENDSISDVHVRDV